MRRVYGLILTLALLAGGCTGRMQEPDYRKHQASFFDLFDTLTIVIGYTESEAEFDRYADIIRLRMEELHRLYDIYHEYEGLNNLCTVNRQAGIEPVAVDQDIMDLLLAARRACELSGGTVNAALGPVLRIWHDYRAAGLADPGRAALPPMDNLRGAAAYTDMDDVIIDGDAGTVFLTKAGMSLDVGSIAKAYATGLAVQAAADAGMRSVLVSAGGNIVTAGAPLDGARDRWAIGIRDPDAPTADAYADIVFFNDLTLSCSGGYERYYTVDGQDYAHIIDPDTLMPANRFAQVAVIHEEPGLADWLSTALFILPYEEGAALAAQCGAEALWINRDGKWQSTEGYAGISQTLGG